MIVLAWKLVACSCRSGCADVDLDPALFEWTHGSLMDSYVPLYVGSDPLPDLPRRDLLCLLDSPSQWVSAHMLLSSGIEFVGKEPVERDGARYFDWYGLVLKDQSATVTPDGRSQACLSRRWRQSPPRPDLCWEEIMGLPH